MILNKIKSKGVVSFERKVEAVLNKIRPSLQADGGDVELVDVDEATGIVKVRLTGACAGAFSTMTLKMALNRP